MAPPMVFLSYAPQDDELRVELEQHLAVLQRDRVLSTWSEPRIAAGDDKRKAIETRIAEANVVLLLVSASYLASDYVYEVQTMTALARSRAGDVRVIPVLVHACDWKIAAFAGLSPLPATGVPVTSWPNRHEAWTAVVRGLREALTGTAQPVVTVEPAYESVEIRLLGEQLERARLRKAALVKTGESTQVIDAEILDLRRRLREGGQLRAGDALGDGRYLLLRSLGHGGFAEVWAAQDRKLGEQVAIKVMHPSQARDASRKERFFRGARVMGELQQKGVVRVLEAHGEDEGYAYFVMELVAGEDLHRAVIAKRLRMEDAVGLILQVGEALGAAHARGIMHRDVKPANVVLDGAGRPKLTDFDLVAAKDTTGGTRTGALGTFLFTAPEQMNNAKEADTRADVYGLGMTTLFCLYGGALPPIATRKPEVVIAGLACSKAVKEVVARAVEFLPEKRYADARTFCEALHAAATQGGGNRSPNRRLAFAGLGVMAIAIVVGAVGIGAAVHMYRETGGTGSTGANSGPVSVMSNATAVPSTDVPSPTAATATTAVPRVTVETTGWVRVNSGRFDMGSPRNERGRYYDEVLHNVHITQGYWLKATEVTQGEWEAVMRSNPSRFRSCGANCPVEQISWHEAVAYCNELSKVRGLERCYLDGDKDYDVNSAKVGITPTWPKGLGCAGYRLPTEAEWEYAVRAGTKAAFYTGDSENVGCEQDANLNRAAWYCGNAGSTTHPVKGKAANAWELYDMLGNVWEWTWDWQAEYGHGEQRDPVGLTTGTSRSARGGSWFDPVGNVRAGHRVGVSPGFRASYIGFRPARSSFET